MGNHRTDPVPGLLVDRSFQEGVRTLGLGGLTYDVWLYHPQLPEAVALARAAPGRPSSSTTSAARWASGPMPADSRRS